ncbi:MAG: hypothetical protein WCF20_07305 [Methylovirgula sp.]
MEGNVVDHPSCTWTGASGNKYIYEVRTRHPTLTLNEPCNFIYAKLDEHRRWVPIYIGHGDLPQRADVIPDAVACIDAKGATHVHVHVVADREDRLAEENDLLENFPQAYQPDGCNEKKAG